MIPEMEKEYGIEYNNKVYQILLINAYGNKAKGGDLMAKGCGGKKPRGK